MSRRTARLLPSLFMLLSTAAIADGAFTVDTLWSMTRIGPFAVSPDGRTVAVAATSFDDDDNTGASRLWLVDVDGRRGIRRLGSGRGSDTSPAWHPDGRHLFFLGVRENRPAQLFRLHVGRETTRALTDLPMAVTAFKVVDGGRAVIFEAATWPDLGADFDTVRMRIAERRDDKTQARISETRVLRYWDHYVTDGRIPHLFRLDLASGRIVDLLPGFDRLTGFDGFEWDASADGRTVVYSANSTATPYRDLDFDLFLKHIDGVEINLTTGNPADDTRPVFAPDGTHIAYGRQSRPAIASDFVRLALLDVSTGQSRPLPADLDGPVSDWRFDPDGRYLYLSGESRGRTHLYRWLEDDVDVVARGGTIQGVQTTRDGVFYARQDFTRPADLWRLPDAGKARRITAFNDAGLADVRFGDYRSIDYRSADGAALQMFVAYPPGYRPGEQYPGVILSHGGPFAAWTDVFSVRWHPGLLAARGYVVAMPNFRGSTGFGQSFADAILGNHGEKPVADTLAAADWLVEHAGVDAERIALAGASYGGYLTALLTGLDQRFTAAIVHAGVYDIGAQFASDSHWSRPSAYGDAPWTDPVRLNAWSPSRFVPTMSTPTLILHGEMDYRVPVTQGINLHGALSGKGVPARIVVFPHEHHWIVRPQAARLWWSEVLGWLDRWLPPNGTSPTMEAS